MNWNLIIIKLGKNWKILISYRCFMMGLKFMIAQKYNLKLIIFEPGKNQKIHIFSLILYWKRVF